MTKLEALRILLLYMPERCIHITEHLDSLYHEGDRREDESAFITVNPGITKPDIEAFKAESVNDAMHKVLDAIGSVTFLNHDTEQAQAFAALNEQ